MKGAPAPWPATLLPSKVANARMLTFGYDARVADWHGMVSRNRIGNHSMNLLAAIATHREDDDTVSSATCADRTTKLTKTRVTARLYLSAIAWGALCARM